MKHALLLGIVTGGLYFVYQYFQRKRYENQHRFIDNFHVPNGVRVKIVEAYPHLSETDVKQVIKALKDYFHICITANRRFVSMPSQVVDVAWHELIIHTKQYQLFCQKAFGRFLHHVPAEAMSYPNQAHEGIRRAWRLACKREKLNPEAPAYLPLLFAIDAKLNITNGFFYSKNCDKTRSGVYCTSDIGCGSSGCGGLSSDSSHSCGGSSGCGSSCGGGCGGGD